VTALCRDCLADAANGVARCKECGGHRILSHGELDVLPIAHLDCDAFYAAVETRDDRALLESPSSSAAASAAWC